MCQDKMIKKKKKLELWKMVKFLMKVQMRSFSLKLEQVSGSRCSVQMRCPLHSSPQIVTLGCTRPVSTLPRHQGGQVCSSLRVKTACSVTGVRAVGLPSWGSHESGNYAQKGVTKGWILTVFAVYFYAYR